MQWRCNKNPTQKCDLWSFTRSRFLVRNRARARYISNDQYLFISFFTFLLFTFLNYAHYRLAHAHCRAGCRVKCVLALRFFSIFEKKVKIYFFRIFIPKMFFEKLNFFPQVHKICKSVVRLWLKGGYLKNILKNKIKIVKIIQMIWSDLTKKSSIFKVKKVIILSI